MLFRRSQYSLLSTEIRLMLMEFKDRKKKKSNLWASREKFGTLWKNFTLTLGFLYAVPRGQKAMERYLTHPRGKMWPCNLKSTQVPIQWLNHGWSQLCFWICKWDSKMLSNLQVTCRKYSSQSLGRHGQLSLSHARDECCQDEYVSHQGLGVSEHATEAKPRPVPAGI